MVRDHIEAIRNGRPVEIPLYDHQTGRFEEPRLFRPAPVVVIEGLHALYPEFLPLLDFRLFVDSDNDVKWAWKFERDVLRRGYDPEEARREMQHRESAYRRWIDFQKTNADVNIKIHPSELASLAVEEYKGQVPDSCYHMEVIVTPTEVPLPSLYLPVDLNNMTQQQAMPFMLANVPSSFWGKPVNVVHVDGVLPDHAVAQLEREIMRLAGIPRFPSSDFPREDDPSTILFTQLLVAWPFLGHVLSVLRQQERKPRASRVNA